MTERHSPLRATDADTVYDVALVGCGLAAAAMLFLNERTRLREDAIIGLIFSSFFALGLFMVVSSFVIVVILGLIVSRSVLICPNVSRSVRAVTRLGRVWRPTGHQYQGQRRDLRQPLEFTK